MLFLLTAPDFTCTCGAHFDSRGDAEAHVETGRCPRQGPTASSAFLTWTRTTGRAFLNRPKTPAEAERRERDLERARALKDNPEYAANAAAKREAERLARLREEAMKTPAAPAATTQEDDAMAKKKATKKHKSPKARKPAAERKPRAPKATKVKVEKAFEIPKGLTAGQVLEREYKGAKIKVTVKEDGFHFDGNTYGTLGKIADQVVGRHVSGPAFFGLWKSPTEKKARKPRRQEAEAPAATT